MKRAARLFLQLAVKINQQIATRDQIDAGKWRIAQHAVARKQDDVAHLLTHAILVAFAGKKTAQPILADVRLNCERKPPLAGN